MLTNLFKVPLYVRPVPTLDVYPENAFILCDPLSRLHRLHTAAQAAFPGHTLEFACRDDDVEALQTGHAAWFLPLLDGAPIIATPVETIVEISDPSESERFTLDCIRTEIAHRASFVEDAPDERPDELPTP
jgi:hypothetical protein